MAHELPALGVTAQQAFQGSWSVSEAKQRAMQDELRTMALHAAGCALMDMLRSWFTTGRACCPDRGDGIVHNITSMRDEDDDPRDTLILKVAYSNSLAWAFKNEEGCDTLWELDGYPDSFTLCFFGKAGAMERNAVQQLKQAGMVIDSWGSHTYKVTNPVQPTAELLAEARREAISTLRRPSSSS
jgi:hypothetical protein